MRISIFGSGYVGLVQAAVFADVGHRVICMDIDAERVERLIRGEVPFFEPRLSEMVIQGVQEGLLTFTSDTKTAVQSSDFLFICVGTPSGDEGSADLRYVMSVADGIAETVGADIELVRQGIGSDPRIGYQFIYPGAGYGGSCFPKDVRALKYLAHAEGCEASILTAVHDTNQRQKNKLAERVMARLGANQGKTIAVWGLAFKPNTDDMREAPSRFLLENIWSCGGKVCAFDPEAMEVCEGIYGERDDMTYVSSKDEALEGADCLVVCTEWKTFWSPDFEAIKKALSEPIIVDGRNLYDPNYLASIGIEYYGIGRGLSVKQH